MSFAPVRNMFSIEKEEFYPAIKTGSDITKPFSYMTTMDLVETDKEYKVIADVPGVDPNNMRVWIQDYALYIKANRKNPYEEEPSEQPKLHHQALPYGEIERRIQLPRNAGMEMAQTEYKYGVLQVSFPKLPQAVEPEHKKLPINVA